MKKYFTFLFFLVLNVVVAQDYSCLTYNIRLDVKTDGENAWPQRKDAMVNQLQFINPDVFGIQEGLPHQVDFLNKELQHFNFIGEGRDGLNNGEFSAIFYNSLRLKVIDQGTFWLSTTPTKALKSWDAALPRICTFGFFEDVKTNTKFWVFNAHFDHLGKEARINSAKLILKKIRKLTKNKAHIILMGDFNATPESAPIEVLNTQLNDSYNTAELKFGPENTFNGFNYNKIPEKRIDYIFTSEDVFIKKYAVFNNSINHRYISDHFPVFVQFKINK